MPHVSPARTTVRVTVNGAPHDVPSGLSVTALLAHLGRDPAMPGVAVALDDAVVRRGDWAETPVPDGARVEIITASQGG